MKKRSQKTCSNFKPISYLPNDLSTVRQSCCYCEYFNDKNCRKEENMVKKICTIY